MSGRQDDPDASVPSSWPLADGRLGGIIQKSTAGKSMIRQSLWYFLIRIGNGVFGIATIAAFTRLMSPQQYGVFALGMAITLIASSILFQWLNVGVGRFYQIYWKKPKVIMSAANRGFGAAAAAGVLVFFLALLFHKAVGLESSLICILLLITIAQGRYDLSLQVANAQRAPMKYALISWSKTGITLLMGISLTYYGAGERGALLAFLAGLVFSVLAFNPARCLGSLKGSWDPKLSGELFRYGLPLTVTFLAFVVGDMSDRFMIAWFFNASHVAPYAATYDLVQQTIGAIMSVLFLAGYPIAVLALEKEGEAVASNHLFSLGRALVGVGLASAVGLAVLSRDIANFFFGEAIRQDAARILPYLAAAIFIGCFKTYYLELPFLLRRATKNLGYIALFMASSKISLNFLLLPRYGIQGAAWATLAAFSAGALMSWITGRRIFHMPGVAKDLACSLCACAVMALALWMLPLSGGIIRLLGKIALGGGIYGLFALGFDIAGSRRWLLAALGGKVAHIHN